jgi:hypothetical protein
MGCCIGDFCYNLDMSELSTPIENWENEGGSVIVERAKPDTAGWIKRALFDFTQMPVGVIERNRPDYAQLLREYVALDLLTAQLFVHKPRVEKDPTLLSIKQQALKDGTRAFVAGLTLSFATVDPINSTEG